MKFYLGTHETSWLARTEVPLFVSRRRLALRKRLPRATTSWALDSGGFTEIATYGRWTISPGEYAAEVRHYRDQIGRLEWAAPQDWMCEPVMLERTGLTVVDHQKLTTSNYAELVELAPDLPWIPVLQGYTLADYLRHVEMYELDLTEQPLVGLGSVCRRQATSEIGEIVGALHGLGIRLHGFGCKAGAIRRYGSWMASADSLAWSYSGRKRGTCVGKSRCQNHMHWALDWRDTVLAAPPADSLQLAMPL